MRIPNNVFLVTGASSGLGAATARDLVARGAAVVLADVDPQGADLASELGPGARFVKADVTSDADLAAAVAAAQEMGAFRGAVSCAGVVYGERILAEGGPHELEAFRRVIEINLVGTFNLLRRAAQALEENTPDEEGERGVIVNTASIAAWEGQIGQAAYAASKGGVVGLTLPAARELARVGIRVVALAPGVFDTPLMTRVSEKYRASLERQTPFPTRFGRPHEFAALVAHVIENRMLNGAALRIDGAMRMQPR